MRRLLVRFARAVVWLAVVMLIAVGAAGIAVGANPLPDETRRPELYTRGDAEVAADLASITTRLLEVQRQVSDLAERSRSALVHLNGGDHQGLVADLDAGDGLVLVIGGDATGIAADLRDLRSTADDWRLSPSMRARLVAAGQATDAVRPLPDLWNQVSRGALPASAIAQHLAEHDRVAFAATQQGVAGRYAPALDGLREAQAELTAAQTLAEQVAETVDTTTLELWIDRNQTYDEALTRLYRELRDSDGRPTEAAQRAFAEVERAERRLPPDTRAIVVIMSDLAQGGLNQAAIRVEEARGALAAALAAVD